jgi:predicted nucleic acid-binding protein
LSLPTLQRALEGKKHVALDTGIFIAATDAGDARRACAVWLLNSVERGRFRCTISVINAAELFVGAIAKGPEAGITTQANLRNFPNLTVAPLTLDLATDAADLRAKTGLSLPDAIVIATAIAVSCDALIHGDRDWRRVQTYRPAFPMVYLGDHCP